MSAQERKEAGAPITPLAPTGNPFATLQSTLRLVQPPGLEGFVAKIQQGIDDYLLTQRQQELDRINAGAAKKLQDEQGQKEINWYEELMRLQEAKDAVEAAEILKDFRVAERLEYIRATAWEGQGKIIPFGSHRLLPDPYLMDYISLGGLRLTYLFPYFDLMDHELPEDNHLQDWFRRHRMKYVPKEGSSNLEVRVLELTKESGDVKKAIQVYSYNHLYESSWKGVGSGIDGVLIPLNVEDAETLLEAVLTQDIINRVTSGMLPSRIAAITKTELPKRQESHIWEKWYTYDPSYVGVYHKGSIYLEDLDRLHLRHAP